jgi:H+/Cl- antiporter ClcA
MEVPFMFLLLIGILFSDESLYTTAFSMSRIVSSHTQIRPHSLRMSHLPIATKDESDTAIHNEYLQEDIFFDEIESPSASAQKQLTTLATASVVGVLTGVNIVIFKRSIEIMREFCYGDSYIANHFPLFSIPMIGGIAVGLVLLSGELPPGLRQTVTEVDRDSMASMMPERSAERSPLRQLQQGARKAFAAATTLGSGNSLGPEGPSVEAGMTMARVVSNFVNDDRTRRFQENARKVLVSRGELSGKDRGYWSQLDDSPILHEAIKRRRLFLSCGAAAGVSAGFNAPLAGVFFALEVVQRALLSASEEDDDTPNSKTQDSLTVDSISISAILLSSVLSALVIKFLLGSEEALRVPSFSLTNPLFELPLYLLLGSFAGILAASFSAFAKLTKSVFVGELGPEFVRYFFKTIPKNTKPLVGSLFCGLMGVAYPQTLFFGYETLNGLLASKVFPTQDALSLLAAKFSTTAVAASSGLVGGTFAPSIFLGGMLGAAFHNSAEAFAHFLTNTFPQISPLVFDVSDLPAYAMVGGASVLAALFRAPLTASLLLFESTKNYDVILPLMASAGIGSLVGDIVEQLLEEQRRDLDNVSWGDLAMKNAQKDDEQSR